MLERKGNEMQCSVKDIERWESPWYFYDIKKEGCMYYVNAQCRGDKDVWFYQWTTGKTLELVRNTIQAFDCAAKLV